MSTSHLWSVVWLPAVSTTGVSLVIGAEGLVFCGQILFPVPTMDIILQTSAFLFAQSDCQVLMQ